MNLRKIFAWMLAASCLAAASNAAAAASKPLLVHYMPWYAAKPYNASWGWHWTMNHYRPDVTEASGRRQIASHYYPLIGPYDSADPAVLEYHVLLMKLAGIDGVIVDWYGPSACPGLDYGALNENTGKLFAYTRKAGLKFSICYEDQSIQHMIESGHLASERALSQAQQAMLYLQSNFWSHSSYFQLDNKPVLLNFGPRYFKNNSQWRAIFSPLPASNSPAFFTEDHKYPVGTGAFPWPPMWLTEAGSKKLAPEQVDHYLAGFYASGKDWAASVGGAWPRFHDIYAEAGGRPSYGYLEDRNGETFRGTIAQAMTNRCAFVQIVTWNDFGEGTMIEPTQEYGYRDLGLVQDLRRQYMDPGFACKTNDLAVAFRLYNLRKRHSGSANISARLDGVFTNVIGGRIEFASRQLSEIETANAAAFEAFSETNHARLRASP